VDEIFEDRWKDRKVEDILKEIERVWQEGRRRHRERNGWILECSERKRKREKGNTNCHGNNAKSTNSKKRR